MIFSYTFLKKIIPSIKSPTDVEKKLSLHAFEVESRVGNSMNVKILPHRYSDAASHWGLAAELSAIDGKKLVLPNIKKHTAVTREKHDLVVTTDACKRMMICSMSNVTIGQSPEWMRGILKEAGIRSINNLVDITNYVTLETGQPLHAFDRDTCVGNTICVRQAKKDERVESLDLKIYELSSLDLVISDEEGALDVAGIKGGKRAEIQKTTKNIVLSAGNFDGAHIYATSKKIGLVTDASVRFSHNISPELAEWGMARAIQLVTELCGGKAGMLKDVYPKKQHSTTLVFDIHQCNRLSGLSLTNVQALSYLARLNFTIQGNTVTAPRYRTDITIHEDLVEEIVRLHGLDNCVAQAPLVTMKKATTQKIISFKNDLRSILAGVGCNEIYTYSFVGENVDASVVIENPISKAYSKMRPNILTNLDDALWSNNRFYDQVHIFEIGQVFDPKERPSLGVGLLGKSDTFREMKGIVQELLYRIGVSGVHMVDETRWSNHLRIESGKNVLGYCGYYDKKGKRVALAELDIDALIKCAHSDLTYQKIAKYPSVQRDISLSIPHGVRYIDIEKNISASSKKFVTNLELIDIYIDKTSKNASMTFRLTFQSPDRTLTDKEVDANLKGIVNHLKKNLKVSVR